MRKSYKELKKLEEEYKILLEKDKIKTKDGLETLVDTSEEIVLSENVEGKKRDGEITKVNQGYLNKVIEKCENCVFILNTNGKINKLNKKMEMLLGYKKEDYDKLSVKSIFPLTEKKTISKRKSNIYYFKLIFCDQKKHNLPPVETSVLDNRKKLIPFQVKAIELKNDKDELVNILFLLKDIRARKSKEEEIKKKKDELEKQIEESDGLEIIEDLKEDAKKTKEHLDSIIESSIDGILIVDTAGFIIRVNKALCKLLDYSQQELIGKHAAELSRLEDKEYLTTYGQRIKADKNYIDRVRKEVFKLLTEGEGYLEGQLIRKDKILVPVISSAYYITDREGQRQEGFNVIRDLTEIKKAESELNKACYELQEAKEYLENIFSTSADGILITDHQGTITRINKAVEKMLGYTQEELKGTHMSQLSVYDDAYYQLDKNMVEKLFKDGKVTAIETIWKGKEGDSIPTELNCALLKDREGEITGGVIGVRDIRERKKIQEIEMKSDFLSNISHELRTPLTSIKGSIDNLLDGIAGKLNDAQKEYLGIVNNESNRLVRLINDLLDLNKLESRSIRLFTEEIEYTSLVAQVVYNLKDLAYEKGLTIKMESSAKEIYLKADRDRVNQILINLINNAIKFTEQGGIKVIIEDSGNQLITTRIKDTGIGIPSYELDKVFDKFHQVNQPRGAKNPGSGLGLPITKNLIKLHGGKIWTESEEDKGSEFCFTLPT